MKEKHLTTEQAILLGKYELTGSALFEALEHVEDCDICRLKVPQVQSETILKRLSATEQLPVEVEAKDVRSRFRFTWSLGLGFAACLAVFGFGIYYFITGISKNDVIVKKGVANQPQNKVEVNSNNSVNTDVNAELAENKNTEVANKTLPKNGDNQNNLTKSVKADVAKNQVKDIILPKIDSNAKTKEVVENSKISNPQVLDERSNLEKFLVKIPATIISLRPNFGNVRGGNNDDAQLILSPNGEVIRETQPTLSWSKAKNVKNYQVSLTDKAYKEVVNEKTIGNSLKVKNPLKRGQTYIFTVTAEKENDEDSNQKPNQPALFRVASEKAITRLEKAEKTGKDWKILSIMLNEGMLSESEKTLNIILSKNPKDKLAVKLLKRVQELRVNSAKTSD
jgi:hypothetical protein